MMRGSACDFAECSEYLLQSHVCLCVLFTALLLHRDTSPLYVALLCMLLFFVCSCCRQSPVCKHTRRLESKTNARAAAPGDGCTDRPAPRARARATRPTRVIIRGEAVAARFDVSFACLAAAAAAAAACAVLPGPPRATAGEPHASACAADDAAAARHARAVRVTCRRRRA